MLENLYIKFLNSNSIGDIKLKIKNKLNIPIGNQRLFFQEELLENNINVKNYKIVNDSVVQLDKIE